MEVDRGLKDFIQVVLHSPSPVWKPVPLERAGPACRPGGNWRIQIRIKIKIRIRNRSKSRSKSQSRSKNRMRSSGDTQRPSPLFPPPDPNHNPNPNRNLNLNPTPTLTLPQLIAPTRSLRTRSNTMHEPLYTLTLAPLGDGTFAKAAPVIGSVGWADSPPLGARVQRCVSQEPRAQSARAGAAARRHRLCLRYAQRRPRRRGSAAAVCPHPPR